MASDLPTGPEDLGPPSPQAGLDLAFRVLAMARMIDLAPRRGRNMEQSSRRRVGMQQHAPRSRWWGPAAVLAIVLLTACAPAAPQAAKPTIAAGGLVDRELVIGQKISLVYLDPHIHYNQNSDVSIEYQMYDQLAFRMPDGS